VAVMAGHPGGYALMHYQVPREEAVRVRDIR